MNSPFEPLTIFNYQCAANFPIMRASSRYGKGNGLTLLDDLMCNGNGESLLYDCDHAEIFQNDCASDHSEDAGVVCGGK